MKSDRVTYWQAYLCLAFLCLDVVLSLGTWIYVSLFPVENIHSLLSAEAVRWLFRHGVRRMASPYFVWIILAGAAWGCTIKSGLWDVLSRRTRPLLFRESAALKVCVFVLLSIVACLLLLTCIPHAILLSATGHLYPSPYVSSIFPLTCLLVCSLSVVYGYVSGNITSIVQVFRALTSGVRMMASWGVVGMSALFSYCLFSYIFEW